MSFLIDYFIFLYFYLLCQGHAITTPSVLLLLLSVYFVLLTLSTC